MADTTAKGKWAFWLMIATVAFFSAVPSLVLVEKARDYYRFLSGWTPGTLKPRRNSSVPHPPGDTPPASDIHFVEFSCDAPGAKEVKLAAGFTGWEKKPLPMEEGTGSRWKVVVPLPPGEYRYAFQVDGKLVADPYAEEASRAGGKVSLRRIP